jgi:hypothetical protein
MGERGSKRGLYPYHHLAFVGNEEDTNMRVNNPPRVNDPRQNSELGTEKKE